MRQSGNFFVETAYKLSRYSKNYYDRPNKAAWHLFVFGLKSLFVNWNISKNCKNTNVLFKIGGGIGDMVIALNFLRALKKYSDPNVFFDLVIHDEHFDQIKTVLQGQTFIRNIFTISEKIKESEYNSVIHLVRIPLVVKTDVSFLQNNAPNFANWIKHILKFNQMYPEFLAAGTVSDKLLEQYTKINNRNRLSEADIDNLLELKVKGGFIINVANEPEILKKFDLISDKYITFQTGCGKRTNGNIRKWSVEYYNLLMRLLRNSYPEYKLVQLGFENSDGINGEIIDLREKTSFNELLVLLKNSKLHIDIEAGCVHFRHFLCAKPSVVLFGPTDKSFYGYSENINLAENECSGCEWLHHNWNKYCIKSCSKKSLCMSTITPNMIAAEIKRVLK